MNDNSNVVELPVITKLDIPVERILNNALDADLERVVIVAETKEGSRYFASSVADGGTVMWMMELAKAGLIEIGRAAD